MVVEKEVEVVTDEDPQKLALVEEETKGNDETKMKESNKKKTKKAKKEKIPVGPFKLDEEKLNRDYKGEPNYLAIIKNLPRLDTELFQEVPKKINPCKNPKFLSALHNGSDAKTTIAAFQLTKEKYKEEYGEEWADPWKKPTAGATGGRGKDTLEMAVLRVKSPSWVRSINCAFNYICDFVYEKAEFRNIDWTSATAEELDVVLGYFWIWHSPIEGGNSLGGTRFTVEVLKQHKTAIANVLTQVLKRTDINIHSKAMLFSNNMYKMKRNMTASEPMEHNAGERKRFAITDEDKEKIDNWVMLPLDKVCITLNRGGSENEKGTKLK